MPINMPCTDCGEHGDATCHLHEFPDEPWLCRGCTDKRVKKLHEELNGYKKVLSPNRLVFLSELMKQGAALIWRRVCEDISPEAREVLTAEEKDALSKEYHEWNGDPHEFTPGHFNIQGGLWLDFFAAKFKEMAERKDGE
jgi:hypothetical protein